LARLSQLVHPLKLRNKSRKKKKGQSLLLSNLNKNEEESKRLRLSFEKRRESFSNRSIPRRAEQILDKKRIHSRQCRRYLGIGGNSCLKRW
jgi:hypothetical protein